MSNTKTAHFDGEWVTVPNEARAAAWQAWKGIPKMTDAQRLGAALSAAFAAAPPAPAAEPVVRIIREKDGSLTAKWEPGYIPTEGDRLFLAPPPVEVNQQAVDLPINDAVPAPTRIFPENEFLWNWTAMQEYARTCIAANRSGESAEASQQQAELSRLTAELDESKRELSLARRDCLALESRESKLLAELSAAKAEAEANAAENAALRKDAERYLWVLLHATPAQVQMLMDRRGDIPSQRKVCDVGMNALTNAGAT